MAGTAWDKGCMFQGGGDDCVGGDVPGGSAQVMMKDNSSYFRVRDRDGYTDIACFYGSGGVNFGQATDPGAGNFSLGDSTRYFYDDSGDSRLETNCDFYVNGTLNAATKTFEIDHPAKPNMTLMHGCLEGPEYGVIYRGKATLENGEAVIELPDYFEALTKEENRTVQLTCIGDRAELYVDGDVKDGKFIVRGDKDVSFYWQVQADRDDEYVRENPFVLEESK